MFQKKRPELTYKCYFGLVSTHLLHLLVDFFCTTPLNFELLLRLLRLAVSSWTWERAGSMGTCQERVSPTPTKQRGTATTTTTTTTTTTARVACFEGPSLCLYQQQLQQLLLQLLHPYVWCLGGVVPKFILEKCFRAKHIGESISNAKMATTIRCTWRKKNNP